MLDGNKNISMPILDDQNAAGENNRRFFEHMDITSHPSTFLLSNYQNVSTIDIREGKIASQSKILAEENFRMIYALKHLKDQYFTIATRTGVLVYDMRYASRPIFEFNHFCEENPLDVIGFSQTYDPMEANEVDDVDDLIKLANNLDFETPVTQDRSGGLLYGYSTDKNGASILFPNKIFSKLDESFKDRFSDLSEKDKYMQNLAMARKTAGDGLSHQYFEPFNQARSMFSTSLISEDYSIRGFSAVHFGQNIVVSSCDNKNNISFQILKEHNKKYQFHQISRNDSDTTKLNEWSQFNCKKQHKVNYIDLRIKY